MARHGLTDLDLERQIASLSKELSALKRAVAGRGGDFYEDGRGLAMEYYTDIADRISHSLPAMRRRARAVENSARDHPATAAAVGLVALGLIAALVFSRR